MDASFPVTCTQCRAQNDSRNKFCEQCASPINDDEFDLLYAPALRDGRKWIGAIAIMYMLGAVLMAALSWTNDQETAIGMLLVNGALSITQGALWWWARRAMFAAAVTSLTLYVTVQLVEAILDPISLLRGWLIKAIFLTVLVKAIKAGLAVRRLRAQAQAQATSAPTTAV